MQLPQLNIQTHHDPRRAKAIRKLKGLEKWATELPIGNTTVASHHMLEQLKSLNSTKTGYRDRLTLHNCLRPVVDELLYAIKIPLKQVNLPLARSDQYTSLVLQQLLEEMATGYKLVVSELVMHNNLREYDRLLLQEAIYLAIIYLSARLLHAYNFYLAEPEFIWKDLNQLYSYACAHQLHTDAIDDPVFEQSVTAANTIDIAYKRIVMLSLSEPYRLMQFEADDIYRIVAECAKDCSFEPLSEIVTRGEYIIYFDQDDGPRFVTPEQYQASDFARIVDIGSVKQQLNIQLEALLKANAHSAAIEVIPLVERQHRDMLLRLADAWNADLIRQSNRFCLDSEVDLTVGLNAGHFYVSDQVKFTPEMDELKLVTHTERKPRDEELRSLFSDNYRESLQKDRIHMNQKYNLSNWWQRNISPIGIALECKDDNPEISVNVGELVTYQLNARKHKRWQLGVIRWFRHTMSDDDEQAGLLNIGVMNLANGARPIAVKALKGLGDGTDYFRSLLIPKQVSLNQIRSMIVPAFLYDIGTVLAVNMSDRLFYAQLNRVMLSTRTFTQFEFKIVNRPVEFLI